MKKTLALLTAVMLFLAPALSLAADLRFTTDVIQAFDSLYLGEYYDAPIEWLVVRPNLTSTNGLGMFLITRNLLDFLTWDGYEYKTSNLSAACTRVYDYSFNPVEKNLILQTTTKDAADYERLDNFWYVFPAPLSQASVFLLSMKEIESYLPPQYREGKSVWYMRNDMRYDVALGIMLCEGTRWTWLGNTSNSLSCGFRPGMNINLADAAYITPAMGGKDDTPGLAPIAPQDGVTAWKLTLDAKETFSAKVSETVYSDDRTVEIDVTAPQGYQDICCILMEMNGEATHYGLVATQNGKATFTLPEELPNGTYGLMLFGEQRNGDNRTDYMTTQVLTSVTLTDRPAVTPTPTPAPSVPATGDGSPLTLLALLGICSAAALLLLRRKALR